jgi:hypothetical protein
LGLRPSLVLTTGTSEVPQRGWSPGLLARAGMVGLMVGNWVGLPEPLNIVDSRSGLGGIGSKTSLHVTAPLGELSKDELLSQRGANSFRGSDCEVSKDNANAAI